MSIYTKTAFDSIKRTPFQAISAIFVLVITFFVATMVSVLVYASNQTLNYFETRPQIIAFLKNDTSDSARVELQDKLSRDSRIKELKFVSKEEALGIYSKATSDNPLLAELVSPSIFPASLEFSVIDLQLAENVISEIKKEAIVDQVGFTANIGGEKTLTDAVNRLKMISTYLRLGGLTFVLVLALTSLVVLLIIISMRMNTRKNEVEILTLIGASPSFVRSPIVIEAIIYSLVGVFIGWFIALVFWLYSSPSIISYLSEIPVLPKDPLNFFVLFFAILGIELVFGILIALAGSLISVSRFLKKMR